MNHYWDNYGHHIQDKHLPHKWGNVPRNISHGYYCVRCHGAQTLLFTICTIWTKAWTTEKQYRTAAQHGHIKIETYSQLQHRGHIFRLNYGHQLNRKMCTLFPMPSEVIYCVYMFSRKYLEVLCFTNRKNIKIEDADEE